MNCARRLATRSPCASAVVAILLLPAAAPATGAEPAILSIAPYAGEEASSGFLSVKVLASAESSIVLQKASRPDSETWDDIGFPFLSTGHPIDLLAPLGEGESEAFFRVAVVETDMTVEDDGTFVTLINNRPAPIGTVLYRLSMETGLPIFPTTGNGGDEELPAVQASAPNVEALLAGLGIAAWVGAPPDDDRGYAGRLFPNDGDQPDPLPDDPGDVGEGRMEEGVPDDTSRPPPDEGSEDPLEPHPDGSMPWHPEISDVPDRLLQEPVPGYQPPGAHVRLVLDVDPLGGVDLVDATDLPGDALLATPFPLPDLGALVCVVRSPLAANMPDEIYSVGLTQDPFAERAYDPPSPMGGAHGHGDLPRVRTRCPLPLLSERDGLDGLLVEFFRYVRSADADVLDARGFLTNPDSFEFLGSLAGDEIGRFLGTRRGNMEPRSRAATKSAEVTTLLRSGSSASKYNLVIIGDGFKDTASDQAKFNDYVDDIVLDDWLSRDIHPEIVNALNIYRINTFSVDSGVSVVNSNGTIVTSRSTALEYEYSGIWSRCWMETGPNTVDLIDADVNALVPQANGIAVVLNTNGPGGCAKGHHFAVTLGAGWGTFAHEVGHFFGGQGDEYQCNMGSTNCGVYGGGEPAAPNLTSSTSGSGIEWKRWIPSWRPLPTAGGNVAVNSQDTGAFPGATIGQQQWWNGIYRPTLTSRMRTNANFFNPVGYTAVRENARPYQEGDLRKNVVGDFDGDGLTDAVILDGRQISLYLARDRDVGPDDPITGNPPRSVTGVLEPAWYHTDLLRNAARTKSWQFRSGDMFFPGDFDGDGMDDIYVVNLTDWNDPYLGMLKSFGDRFEPVRRYDIELPGWDDMRDHDEFYVGDFTGDGRDDLFVYNGVDWNMPYFIMLRSDGTRLVYVRRYDRFLPVWEMGDHERFFVGDYNDDGKEEVIAQNRDDWSQVHFMVFTSNGSRLFLKDRYYGTIKFPFWTMRRKDEIHILDFNGDGTSDVAIFNGKNWGPEYLGLFTVDEGFLTGRRRYEDTIPGWDMRRRDRFWTANVDGDNDDDLVVYNSDNWATQYLGMLRSDGEASLQGSWQKDWIGGWNLGAGDDFQVADFRGAGAWDDLFVFNEGWFGLLRSYSSQYALETIYRKWIKNHRYHDFGWW